MNKEMVLGPEAKAFMRIEGGKILIGVEYAGVQASANAVISLDAEQFAGLLKAAIPGQIDDMVIDVLVAALKAA